MATSSYYNSSSRHLELSKSAVQQTDPSSLPNLLVARGKGLQVSARSSRERWARSGFPGQLRLRFFAKDPLFLTKRKGPQVMQIREHKSCNGKQKLYSVLVAHPFHCDLCRPFVQESL
ncbi:hypothetical protein GN956_G25277 [Arapaima gigas]